jgi:hypothetical protein
MIQSLETFSEHYHDVVSGYEHKERLPNSRWPVSFLAHVESHSRL